jgi:Protein of unknown function (DUF1566)
MQRKTVKWLSGFGVMVVIGTFVLANYGIGIPPVGAQAVPPNPLTVILQKLDQVLAALGGVQEGNHTLRWDRNFPSASRFVVLAEFNNQAVLDKNTGLVWEQAPGTTTRLWAQAGRYCINKSVGGTRGWRLPSVIELKSIQDPSLPARELSCDYRVGCGFRWWLRRRRRFWIDEHW